MRFIRQFYSKTSVFVEVANSKSGYFGPAMQTNRIFNIDIARAIYCRNWSTNFPNYSDIDSDLTFSVNRTRKIKSLENHLENFLIDHKVSNILPPIFQYRYWYCCQMKTNIDIDIDNGNINILLQYVSALNHARILQRFWYFHAHILF